MEILKFSALSIRRLLVIASKKEGYFFDIFRAVCFKLVDVDVSLFINENLCESPAEREECHFVYQNLEKKKNCKIFRES